MSADNVAKVVGVGSVGQHVGNFELFSAFRVGISGHDNGDFASAQVVGSGLVVPHAFDAPLAIAEGDELLKEFWVTVLDVVEVDHHVVAYLKGEVESLDFGAGGGVDDFGGV